MNKSVMTSLCCSLLLSAVGLGVVGCNTAPTTTQGRQELTSDAQKALSQMEADAPGLQTIANNAYAYVVFPSVGQGAFIVGGGHGHGEAYQGAQLVGYAELTFVNVGAQVGGQDFSELLVFRTKDAFDKFTNNNFTLQAAASAVILKSGAAAEAKWQDDVAVFARPTAGAMVEAAIGGQRFTYKALGATPAAPSTSGT
jgi:lipid-binding SYLF domain-containing protein